MARVTIQQGHVPRVRGATGTHREQEFVRALAPRIADRLRPLGHDVVLIGADDPVPPGDVFVALHTDGSTSRDRRGASVGYPDGEGGRLAAAWKRAHQRRGYPGGFLNDNYTAALRGYYGFGRARGYRWRFLAEHGTTTNPLDEAWLFGHLDACADAHTEAIGEAVGHPGNRPPDQGDGDLTPNEHAMLEGVFNGVRGQNEHLLPRIVKLLEEIKTAVQQRAGGG